MEGFEHVCKVALEAEKFIVSSNLKFPVSRQTSKATPEIQTHGYEVDLVGARQNKLVLASVKSFFGSTGVSKEGFKGLAAQDRPKFFKRYCLFNDLEIQQGVISAAADRFGYKEKQIELRLYVGKFKSPADQIAITDFLKVERDGFRSVKVIGLQEVFQRVEEACAAKTYFNDPVIMTMKALKHLGELRNKLSD